MDEDNFDPETYFDDFFGRTPLQTPFGSQDSSLSCVIDISDEEDPDDTDDILPAVDINERVRQYLLQNQCDAASSGEASNGEESDNIGEENDEDEDLKRVRKLKAEGCKCSLQCSDKSSEVDMIDHIRNVQEMERGEKDMYVMGTLVSCDTATTTKGKKRKRCSNTYMFQGRRVCRPFFMVVYAMGKKCLRNLTKHLEKHGAVPRIHGNVGKQQPHRLVFEDIKTIVQFIITYADAHGMPQPAARQGSDNTPPIYLHCQNTKRSLHSEYIEAAGNDHRSVKYTTWIKIWRSCVPHIRIASPREDVCATCEKRRKVISDARTEEDKLASTASYREHIITAQLERDLYNQCLERARDGNGDGTNYFHATFDYCQNVTIPHHGRQMGPLYFTTPRKIQIFGVRIDGIPKQLNFIIDENETIGKDGTLTHGPNAVISMLDWVLDNYASDEPTCALHADNCTGQNKNRFVLAYLMWRVMTGRNTKIDYMFLIPGHTRCQVDGGFGRIKQVYRRSDCDTIDQLEDVINRAAGSSEAVRFPSWQWRDWKSFLGQIFRPIKGIRSYQYFGFSSDSPGAMTVRRHHGREETTIRMLKPDEVVVFGNTLPNVMLPAGLSRERQTYLYRTVRPFVRPGSQDSTCPAALDV